MKVILAVMTDRRNNRQTDTQTRSVYDKDHMSELPIKNRVKVILAVMTDRRTDGQTDRHTDRQTDRQTETKCI